jgi:hypothetical protein
MVGVDKIFSRHFLAKRQAALIFSFAMMYKLPKGDHLMADSKLRTLSIDFAVQILDTDFLLLYAKKYPAVFRISA